MKNLSRKTVLLIAIALSILAVIVGLFLVDSGFAKILVLISCLIVPSIILATNLEKDGPLLTILLAASPLLSAIFSKLSKFGLANGLTEFYNICITWLFTHLEIESDFSLGNEGSLLVTFWLLVVIVYGVKKLLHWGKTRERKAEFREKNYSEKCSDFCLTLRQRIERINRETDWNENTFTPLDAEIEACFKKKRKKKFDDLLKCLKAYRKRNTIFLVLGDPGAGKSVAMRKLCLDLLDDVKNTGLVPVYVDLKKWKEPWSINNPPNKKDLISFIKSILKENGDFSADDFVDVYFDRMLENGRWYFIFDSFDELPCLMGAKDCRQLIDELSELFYTFLTGPNQRGGVISSRLFRAPSSYTLHPTVTMTVQPFNDIKIKTMLRRYSSSTVDTDKKLFGQREDLVALCRNPFYLSLLINYYKQNGMKLPENQMELFKSFIDNRLNKCLGKIVLEGMTVEQIRSAATELAIYMEESPDYGLECPVQSLINHNTEKNWSKILELLAYAKICRFGGTNDTVSFVHRRFQEFFHVEHIIANQVQISQENYKSILYNNGLRDALVLYCEIAEESQVKEIARYCWTTVQSTIENCSNIRNAGCTELVNTLYFMAEAFRNRKEVVSEFLYEFQNLVEKHLTSETDFAVQLALVNSMILFEQSRIQEMVLKVLKLRNRWLSDIVMLNSRTITTKLDGRVEEMIIRYFGEIDIRSFLSGYRNTDFSLSISKHFFYLRFIHKLRLMAYLTFYVISCVALIHVILRMPFGAYLDIKIEGVVNKVIFVGRMSAITVVATNLCNGQIARWSSASRLIKAILFCSLISVVDVWFVLLRATAKTMYFLTIIPYLLLVGGCTAIPFCYNFFRSNNAEFRKKYLVKMLMISSGVMVFALGMIMRAQIVQIVISILLFVCIGLGIVLCIRKNIQLRTILLGLLKVLCLPTLVLVQYFADWRWIRELPDIKSLSRLDLTANLEQHSTPRWRRAYVDSLLQNKVKLTGNWPSETRPQYNDNELNYNLMKLDCADIDVLRKPF